MASKLSPKQRAFLRSPKSKKFQAEIKDWQQRLDLTQSLGSPAPPVEIPTIGMLRQPGELERLFSGIKIRFELAEHRSRELIDREVKLCMQTAKLLDWSVNPIHKVTNESWDTYWRKSDKKPSNSLRFVFLSVHGYPKKASFYYRATRALFEEGCALENLSRRITEGGGYGALAKANVRFPRPKKTPGMDNSAAGTNSEQDHNEETQARLGEESVHQDVDSKYEPTAPLRRKCAPQPDAAGSRDGEPETVLIADFEGEGHDFLGLPVGCYARVCLQITANNAGRRTIRIYCAIADE